MKAESASPCRARWERCPLVHSRPRRSTWDPDSELRADFVIRPDAAKKSGHIEVDSEKVTLKVGDYSDWLPVKFKAGLGFGAKGIAASYLKEVSPEVEVYVTPVNIDPSRPDLPISHPVTYSIYLAKISVPTRP